MDKVGSSEEKSVERYKRIGIVVWAALGVLALFGGALFLIAQLRAIFALFVYTLVLVYVLKPVVNFFEKKKIPRVLAVLLTYLLIILILTLLLMYFIPIVVKQIREFGSQFPQYLRTVIHFFQKYLKELETFRISPAASGFLQEGLAGLKKILFEIISRLPGITFNVVAGFFYLLLAPVIAFYILKDLRKIRTAIMGLVPQPYQEEVTTIIQKVDMVMGGFLRGQLLVALSVGILASLSLWIIGVNYPLLIGMFTGILDIIPYFGPLAGMVLASIVALFESPLLALKAIAVLLIIQQIEAIFISPYILGEQVNLHPVLVIFSLLVGGALFGFLGLVLAIPVVATGKALVIHFQEKQLGDTNDK